MDLVLIYVLDGDGVTDLRIRAWSPPEVENDPPIMHTYIVSGLTGSPLYLITGDEPFDPWAEVPGDADGDGDVSQDDLDLIAAASFAPLTLPGSSTLVAYLASLARSNILAVRNMVPSSYAWHCKCRPTGSCLSLI